MKKKKIKNISWHNIKTQGVTTQQYIETKSVYINSCNDPIIRTPHYTFIYTYVLCIIYVYSCSLFIIGKTPVSRSVRVSNSQKY